MTPILVFDIETVPDVPGIRRVEGIAPSVSDDAVLAWSNQRRRARSGNEFLSLQYQRVVAIACALREDAVFKIGSVGTAGDSEAELIRRFFDLIDRHTPQLVSWNGGAFDLPVLSYRALIHGVTAAKFWDWGDDDREFKFNSYLGRFHTRHVDLMDVLSMYQLRASAGLDSIARLCGFPGKIGMDGSGVYSAVLAGRLDDVRRYCEADVMNTYLVYQRFRLLRGEIGPADYENEIEFAREKIAAINAPHWSEFMRVWDADTGER